MFDSENLNIEVIPYEGTKDGEYDPDFPPDVPVDEENDTDVRPIPDIV
jgi:hypothetical protein